MSSILTAFRLFGDFHWPPIRAQEEYDSTKNNDALPSRTGVVEIFYAPVGTNYIAVLRWIPKDLLKGAVSLEIGKDWASKPNIADRTDKQLTEDDFGDGKQVVVLNLGPSNTKPLGRRLLFRGALVLDQFKLDEGSNYDLQGNRDPVPDLRLVLARHFEQEGQTYFSELVIGQPGDSKATGTSYRLNLALPSPGPHAGTTAGGQTFQCYAFPFATVFSAVRTKQDAEALPARLRVRQLIAGPGGHPNDGPLWDDPVDPSTSIDRPWLGGFGLCSRLNNTSGLGDYIYTPRQTAGDTLYRQLWQTTADHFRDGVLSKLGKVVGLEGIGTARPVPQEQGDENWHSLRFIDRTDGDTRTVMVFRTGVRINKPTGGGEDGNDLAWVGGRLKLRAPGTNQWLDVGTEIFVELELSYWVPSERIWDISSTDGGRIGVRIGFVEEWKPKFAATSVAAQLDAANRGMRLARLDLRNLTADQPETLLPEIQVRAKVTSKNGNLVPQRPMFVLQGSMPFQFAGAKQLERVEWGRQFPGRKGWPGLDMGITLWPSDRNIHPAADQEQLLVDLLPSQFSNEPAASVSVYLRGDANAGASLDDPLFQFSMHEATKSSSKLAGRLGGLQLAADALALPDHETEDYSHWRFGWPQEQQATLPQNTNTANQFVLADLDFRLRLVVTQVVPLGLDLSWGDRTNRPLPLLIPVGSDANAGQFILDARETIGRNASRWLRAELFDRGTASGEADTGSYVVLSEAPFSITRFTSKPLQDRGGQENAIVASYDSDQRFWQMRLVSPTYNYELPPQAVGESMDKPRRLEIVDYGYDEQPKKPGDARPDWPIVRESDGLKRRAVEFRLTPSAELWIRPSDVERGYFRPEWASHEIFRQSGALGLGAALAALRAEFLYGLPVGIDTSKETGAARTARVAELEALTGHPPRRLGASDQSDDFAKRWHKLEDVLERRPERLEIWARDPSSTTPFADARFTDGVQFALRHTALVRPPLADLKAEQDFANGGPAGALRISELHGLSGGALWPMESRNFFNAVQRAPASSGGSIERIALSPIGGDADQTAKFLNNQLAIISETRNGFVQRHKVEIVGRIGVFWHRAKHVVVYERTVSPSAQFVEDLKQTTRRPVLRKVSEYVELLEPVRNYPDFTTAKPAAAGFLKAVRFNQKIIFVDSAWGEDVEDYGWKVPLWNKHAAKQRPQVYPRPDIGFVTVAEGEGEQPQATQECLEPDNIYFFADSTAGNDLTDTWFSRGGIDFSHLPPPTHAFQRSDAATSSGGQNHRPGAARVPRGHRRFTWRLAPAGQKVALNAARSGQPLYAGLDSITFMRSNLPEMPAGDFDKAAGAIATTLGTADVNAEATATNWTDNPAYGETRKALAEVAAGITAGNGKTIRDALTRVYAKADTAFDKLSAAAGNGARALADLKKLARQGPQRCEQMAGDLVGSIQRKQLLILENVRSWESDAHSLIPEPPIDAEKLRTKLIESLSTTLDHALAGVSEDIGNVQRSIASARGVVDDFASDVSEARSGFADRLHGFARAYDDGRPWSDNRLNELADKLKGERHRVVETVRTAVEDANIRIATELDDLSSSIGKVVSEAMAAHDALGTRLTDDLERTWSPIEDYKKTATARIKQLRDLIAKARPKLADLEAKARQKYQDKYDSAFTTLSNSLTRLSGLLNKVETLLTGLTKNKPAKLLDAMLSLGQDLLNELANAADQTIDIVKRIRAESVALGDAVIDEVATAGSELLDLANDGLRLIAGYGGLVDELVGETLATIETAFNRIADAIAEWLVLIKQQGEWVAAQIDQLKASIGPDAISGIVRKAIVTPALDAALGPINDNAAELRRRIAGTSEQIRLELEGLTNAIAGDAIDKIKGICAAIGGGLDSALTELQAVENAVAAKARQIIDDLATQLTGIPDLPSPAELERYGKLIGQFETDAKKLGDDLVRSSAAAKNYSNRVLDSIGNVGSGGVGAVPGNVLRLWAAAASPPELPNLDFARERLGYYYGQLNDIIDTTPVEAWFGRLGDELKALGLSLPFSQLGDRIVPDNLSNFDIGRILKNFGGMKLDKLFSGYKLPKGARDAIKVTHAFDKKQFRAWVQVDIDLPVPGRKSLFTIGPFQLDFVDSRLKAVVRLEASKDSDRIDQQGRAALTTNIDAVVAGQSMVMLQQVVARYEKSSGLKVDFDAKKIKLNQVFKFIQDTLGSIFPDDIGGVKLIKDHGIPVGIEHEFSMPPVALMFGTSGVTNIAISNRFALVAFPDFVISDRFCLSRPEAPFIFSIFILGGTGYITVDTEYRPFDNRLMVVVEAAAGASASLGFAFGPVSGSVYITLSVALAYRKVFGQSGGGLTVSLVLVVAGNVDVCGIVTVFIVLMLRMSYRDNGQIDADGTLSLTIRISRFFKIKVRANVRYKLRGGKSQTTSSVSSDTEITDPQLAKAKAAADKLLEARG